MADSFALHDVDNTTTHTYTKVMGDGYNSLYRDLAVDTNLGCKLEVKNTIDLSATSTKPNRHLISVTRGVEDSVTGEIQNYTVHTVVTRHKDVPDSDVQDLIHQMAEILGIDSIMDDLLNGSSAFGQQTPGA